MKVHTRGSDYEVLSEGIYVTKSAPDKPYKKYKLSNNKVLVVSETADFAYLGEDSGNLSIKPGGKIVNYREKEFRLVESDYQVLKQVKFGKPEGNVQFWDYENGDEIISLGIEEETKKRSDVVGRVIDKKKVKFL